MRNTVVRVFDSSGRPVQGARVSLWIYQFAASGSKEAYTNSSGEAEFDLDVDTFAEISVSVNGTEYHRRGSIQGQYRVNL